ncbi:MATE efflux family protein [Methanobacterium lacus]|uniref:MATE efflux family protein n=1 Tax=Methanobacterium lacus (strain AL-21) TaxID=877455 RepID=F0T8J9_METLA|nr:MATE family efflux transporter [Methanobacterium lacus]ADZ09750.1 MATE efflux family protein [Methanobacterium lacus]
MENNEPLQSSPNLPTEDDKTEGVSTILGDPKKALIKLSGPMIIAMILMSLYNVVNAVWVAGLGGDALAAVGFVTPLFMMFMGLSNGLGAGAASAISRYIGEDNKKSVNNAAMHSVIITIGISVILSVVLLIFLKPLLLLFGAGSTLNLAVEYGQIIIGGTILSLFVGASYGILRAEGDVKRTMYAMVLSSVVNMILDPILIYWAGWGISGAAWGTIISTALVAIILLYWLFIKKDTYVSLTLKDFKPDLKVTKNILSVGLPASVEFFVMSILAIFLNILLVKVAGTDAVAVYNTGWRVVMISMSPIIGVGLSVVTIVGASYGAKKYGNISMIHNYSVKIGLVVSSIICVLIYLLAPYIAMLFTYSSTSAYLEPAIASFLQVMCLFFIFLPLGIMSSSAFQGVGKGTTSLILTVLREVVFVVLSAYILAITLGWGENGVWWGIVIGGLLGGLVAYAAARIYIKGLNHDKNTGIHEDIILAD